MNLPIFRKFIKSDEDVSKDFGNDFFRTVKRRSNYEKENGEFYSVALSLYLSRLDSSHVIFYTDDKPAEEHFASFFRNQQIGKIQKERPGASAFRASFPICHQG